MSLATPFNDSLQMCSRGKTGERERREERRERKVREGEEESEERRRTFSNRFCRVSRHCIVFTLISAKVFKKLKLV